MKFIYPLPPNSIVTQTFAEHVHRARVNGWQNYNGGIDWAIPTGSRIKAAQSGVVKEVRRDATGYGVHVRIQHDEGYLTIYGHLQDFSVKAGDAVTAGQAIGRSDNTGNSTGPHLHFELRKNNVAIDPAPLLVTALPTGEEEEEEEEEGQGEISGSEPQSFPKLPKARVTSNIGLNIRMGPGVGNPVVGYLPRGKEVEVLRKSEPAGDTWLQIGYQQYIAMQVGGDTLAEWLEPV
jgi:hypothetical protein